MTDPPDQHEDEPGPPIVEDLTDAARELEREQADRAAMEAALAELRGGDPETARRTLAARLEEVERCPICGARDGEACDSSKHEPPLSETTTG